MRLTALLAILWLLPTSGYAETVTIQRDMGGDLGLYEVRLGVYASLGIKVRIDGVCASACTILTRLPANLVCATQKAELHFHKTRASGSANVSAARLEQENSRLLALYPSGIRTWINIRGGLTDEILTMPPQAVSHYLRSCPPDTGSVIATGLN
jgi:hypothetical protein